MAFTSTRDGGRDLYRVDVESGAVRRLTTGLDVWSQPGWSPDGRKILFSAREKGVQEVYVIDADGGSAVRLTRGAEGLRGVVP